MKNGLKVGDKLRDNDPRMRARSFLTVTEVASEHVSAIDASGRLFTYSRKRVFTDCRNRRTGLSLVVQAA